MVAAAADVAKVAEFNPVGGNLEFYGATDPEVLAVGPAGSGKTMTAVWKLHDVAMGVPGVRILMARKVLEDLKTGALATYTNHVKPELDGVITFGGNRFYPGEFRYPNGSVIHVVGMDKPGKVMSSEYDIIFCFTGDTKVESPSPIEKGYRREYSGPLVTIRTASGNELTGTPNHPILTDKGWVALGLLREGDNVISRSSIEDERPGRNPNVEDEPATFAEVFRSLLLSDSSRAERVKTVGMDFHGDGSCGEVDIVTTARGLRAGVNAPLQEHLVKHDFVRRDLEPHALMSHGAPVNLRISGYASSISGPDLPTELAHSRPVLVGINPSLASTLSGGVELLSPVGAGVSDVAVAGSSGLTSGTESAAAKLGLEGTVANPDGGGDFIEAAFPFEVAADRIVHVLRTHTDERSVRHVYNLQTQDHYYIANNIIAHNCNEATELSEKVWQALKSRLRNGVLGYQQLMADCNPSGPRHWLNKRCNAGTTRRIVTTHKDNPAYWDADRQEWTEMGRMYVQDTLGSLTGIERERLFLGKWAAAEGLVYPEFNPDVHEQVVDTDGWRCVLGVDVGTNNPTAILVAFVAGDGRIHIADELYQRGLGTKGILDAVKGYADEYNPDAVYVDPSAKAYITDLHAMGIPAIGANNDVLTGIQRVRSVFQTGFTIDPKCTNTIDEFGMYAYPSKSRTETDKPEKEHDHSMDALRYLCMGAAEPVISLKDFYS